MKSARYDDEQKHFLHGNNMELELLARSLSKDKYFGSVNWTLASTWKKFYIECFEILERSIFTSIGYVDPSHKQKIKETVASALTKMRAAKRKDEVHGILTVALFKLVFLLLGRLPYSARSRKRSFSTFRTLTYSQSEEQLSWLLQGAIQQNPEKHGFKDSFEADMSFFHWAKGRKLDTSDRSVYVAWVETNFAETLNSFR